MIAAENWCIKVADKIYGPYSSDQMRKLAHEGRLASWSLVSPAGSRAWREAREERRFTGFFGVNGTVSQGGSKSPVTKRGAVRARRTRTNGAFGKAAADQQTGSANFIVIFDVDCCAAKRIEAAIHGLGPAFQLTQNVWTVTCELTAAGVKNAIAPHLSPHELIFVVDSTRGRSSWQNFSPEAQTRVADAFTPNKQ